MIGLVSTWNEGQLAVDAIRSLFACCSAVRVLDGPIGDAEGESGQWEMFRRESRVIVQHGVWGSDAEKRTALLAASRRYPTPTWGVVLDADEALLHGEHLPAVVTYYEAEAERAGKDTLRIPLRLVDGDGTSSVMTGRVLRLDLIERYVSSSYEILLRNGVTVALGNGKLRAGNEPDSLERDVTTGFQLRRPLQGEPHILHRSFLRPPQRTAERQSAAEGSAFDALVAAAGLAVVQGEQAQDDRPAIWLPSQ